MHHQLLCMRVYIYLISKPWYILLKPKHFFRLELGNQNNSVGGGGQKRYFAQNQCLLSPSQNSNNWDSITLLIWSPCSTREKKVSLFTSSRLGNFGTRKQWDWFKVKLQDSSKAGNWRHLFWFPHWCICWTMSLPHSLSFSSPPLHSSLTQR